MVDLYKYYLRARKTLLEARWTEDLIATGSVSELGKSFQTVLLRVNSLFTGNSFLFKVENTVFSYECFFLFSITKIFFSYCVEDLLFFIVKEHLLGVRQKVFVHHSDASFHQEEETVLSVKCMITRICSQV